MWPNSTGAESEFFYKTQVEDFWVAELPLAGRDTRRNHWYGYVEKRNRTTLSVADQLASSVAQPASVVGYAGMKDKVGVTQQWFSLPAAQGGGDMERLAVAIAEDDSLRLLAQGYGGRKLRRGELRGNRFRLRLVVPTTAHRQLELALLRLSQVGFPNYFGPQRFGEQQSNLQSATRWLGSRATAKGRQRQLKPFTKGLYLSVLRAFLFNEVLAARVRGGNWHEVLDGDLCLGPQATAPLWGRGRSQTQRAAATLEVDALTPHLALCEGLEHAGVVQMRRPLQVRPRGLSWRWSVADAAAPTCELLLKFELPPGSYASSLLAEMGTPLVGDGRACGF